MADGPQAAMWITLLLMALFGICFLFNIKTIKLSREIEEYIVSSQLQPSDSDAK
jgi:hypothetical protein